MVGLRAFDGLDADAILELGWERLDEEHAARAAAAREIDADADETDRHRPREDRTSRPTSRPPSMPIATRCSGRAGTSSSTT